MKRALLWALVGYIIAAFIPPQTWTNMLRKSA